MPKPWNETIQDRRVEVCDAILDTTWALVAQHGLLSVTMSQIAAAVGISRPTLYKYFPDIEAILLAYHERHVAGHLARLADVRDRPGSPLERLDTVLHAYALICFHRERSGGAELGALLHRGDHLARVEQQLIDLFQELLTEVVATGELRDDAAPAELANYCLHALAAAGNLPSEEAVKRLVTITIAGLRPVIG